MIVFSHLRWDFVYQRPQQLLSRLAQQYKVVFIEEPVRCAEGTKPRLACRETAAGVTVVVPHTEEEGSSFSDEQVRVIRPMLALFLREKATGQCVAWFYTPLPLPLLDILDARLVVFDCMDELSAFHGAPSGLQERERELLEVADIVFTGGPSLYEAKRSLHGNLICLPSGVDARHYEPGAARAKTEAVAVAARLQEQLSPPRLGYIGVVDERIDIDLVAALADAEPGWQVVMVGPVVKINPRGLPQRPNLHWLGFQPYHILPQIVLGWDVCLLPFALNEATRYISPTKTLEYMAAEKPVISTRVNDVVALYGDLVHVAASKDEFINASRAAVGEKPHARKSRILRMRERVSQYSWDAAANRVLEAIQVGLSTRAGGETWESTVKRANTLNTGAGAA